MKKNHVILPLILFFLCSFVFPAPLHSPTWGYTLDLPEGYEYSGGDGKNSFSFENQEGAQFDIAIFHAERGRSAPYPNVEELAKDIKARLNSSGDLEVFEYLEKKAILLELEFSTREKGPLSGWALCMELDSPGTVNSSSPIEEAKPLLLATAYGPAGKSELGAMHLSALDSLIPAEGARLLPGPITEFAYPRKTRVLAPVYGLDMEAHVFKEDAEAAQALVEREFKVLTRYANTPYWQEAWKRYYRAIYRDSFDRVANIAFLVERKLNVPERENRDFADQVLHWVQSFEYARDHSGSDFMNVVTAASEGKNDCDSRAMLWAIVLKQAGIPSAIMVSRHYGHAMGLAELDGSGARFEVGGKKLLVAETTAKVSIGLIGETVSDIEHWLGILFE